MFCVSNMGVIDPSLYLDAGALLEVDARAPALGQGLLRRTFKLQYVFLGLWFHEGFVSKILKFPGAL